jgi:hypothetical protein
MLAGYRPWPKGHSALCLALLSSAGCLDAAAYAPARQPSPYDYVNVRGGFSPAYAIGSLAARPEVSSAASRNLGCVELRAEATSAHVAPTTLAVAFSFGNRCAAPARIDLSRVTARATWADGRQRDLTLFDPHSVVVAATLDGRAQGTELLELDAPFGSPPGPAESVCVDVSGIVVGASAPRVEPVCLTSRGTFANVDTVVGHSPFKTQPWRRTPFHILYEIGMATNYVDFDGTTWSGATKSHASFRLDASRFRGGVDYGVDMRLAGWVAGPLYVGAMLQGAVGALASTSPMTLADTPVRSDDAYGDIQAGALVGVGTRGSRSPRLRFDVTLGARDLVSDVFPPGCSAPSCEWDTHSVRPLIAPRVVVDTWLTPWISLATWTQADALYLPDVGVGLAIAVHPWAFDGLP